MTENYGIELIKKNKAITEVIITKVANGHTASMRVINTQGIIEIVDHLIGIGLLASKYQEK